MKLRYEKKVGNIEISKLIEDIKQKGKSQGFYIIGSKIYLGDNFEIMINLLENYENKIDLIYIDPPYNTKESFFYNKYRTSTVSKCKDDIVAYEDSLKFEEYLEFIRIRLLIMKKLLGPNGTIYFHIDIKVGHYIKVIMDEVFGQNNFINEITRVRSNPKNFKRKAFGNEKYVIYIYSKEEKQNIFNDIRKKLNDREIEKLFTKIDSNGSRYTTVPCHAPGETQKGETSKEWRGIKPSVGRHWRTNVAELERLDSIGLIICI